MSQIYGNLPRLYSTGPMDQINPYYTQMQQSNSFAPLAMYQNYKRTGKFPAELPSSYTPYNPPPVAPSAAPADPTFTLGSK